MMKENYVGKLLYLTFPELEKYSFLKHAFSTRHGGVSENEFATMNLGFSRGDDRNNVLENYKKICDACGFDINSLVAAQQVHGTNIRTVKYADCGTGIFKNRFDDDVDALITNEPGITLVTYFADCVPLYFVDIKQKVIALAHAGWRGTAGLISVKTIQKFQNEYNSKIEDIICAIGPSIGKCCYEVNEDVKNIFENLGIDSQLFIDKISKKYMLDLCKVNKLLLLKAGILHKNILKADLCTSCNSDMFFSYRATNGKRGTMAAFLCLV